MIRYILTGLVFLLILFGIPEPAYADNCGSLSDCYGVAIAAAIAGVAIPILISLLLDFSPFGRAKGILEAILGRDLITGDKLAWWERLLNIIPGIGKLGRLADEIGDGAKAIDKVGDLGKAVDKAEDAAKAIDKVGDLGKAVDKAEDAAKAIDKVGDLGKAVDKAEDAAKAADQVGDLGKLVTQGNYSQVYSTTEKLARGNLGERLAADALAAQGHEILMYKPSILGTNQGGIDIISMKDGVVHFIDNKAITRSGNVSSASALTTNFAKNLATARDQLSAMLADSSCSAAERRVIQQALDSINNGNYVRAITNANITRYTKILSGVTQRLANEGIIFIDVFR